MSHSTTFYSHVNYSVTKIVMQNRLKLINFYSHVNYSVTKIVTPIILATSFFYSHVNYSVTKIYPISYSNWAAFTVT